ncbi:MAG: nucleotidyltransferase, partial [Oscillospiraceae bacterium]|nr:nucleotidyltransferase [Oscillospiraceae bacterium]
MAKGPALFVMAAGMGSRYGGLKQIDPISPAGETILDFSVYDALEAGFEKIVLLIKRSIENEFEEIVGGRLRRQTDIEYAFQEVDDLPPGFSAPPDRVKPWGTGHALWSARNALDRPFAVINADDYYGKSAYKVMHGFLTSGVGPADYAMVSYMLGQTLTEHGTVARGVCEVSGGMLTGITERT